MFYLLIKIKKVTIVLKRDNHLAISLNAVIWVFCDSLTKTLHRQQTRKYDEIIKRKAL